MSFGFNSSGQIFVSVTANATLGAGFYAGVGGQVGGGYTDGPLPTGLSTERSVHTEANIGAGLSRGVSGDVGHGSASGFKAHGGVGYGFNASTGIATTTTLASPPIFDIISNIFNKLFSDC